MPIKARNFKYFFENWGNFEIIKNWNLQIFPKNKSYVLIPMFNILGYLIRACLSQYPSKITLNSSNHIDLYLFRKPVMALYPIQEPDIWLFGLMSMGNPAVWYAD